MRVLIFFIVTWALLVAGEVDAQYVKRKPQQVGGDIGMRGFEIRGVRLSGVSPQTSFSFQGSEAISLYSALPKSISAADPEDSAGFVAHGEKISIILKCIKKQFDPRIKTYVQVVGGQRCEVFVKETDPAYNLKQEQKWSH